MNRSIPAKPLYSVNNLKNFYALCKPRVTGLIVFTAIIGMFLSTPGMVPIDILIASRKLDISIFPVPTKSRAVP